jgi:hypothetical protein
VYKELLEIRKKYVETFLSSVVPAGSRMERLRGESSELYRREDGVQKRTCGSLITTDPLLGMKYYLLPSLLILVDLGAIVVNLRPMIYPTAQNRLLASTDVYRPISTNDSGTSRIFVLLAGSLNASEIWVYTFNCKFE